MIEVLTTSSLLSASIAPAKSPSSAFTCSLLVSTQAFTSISLALSGPITGGTMVTDDGSSRSQSEVHERNLDDKLSEADRRMVAFVVNNQLMPMLAHWHHPVNPATDYFQFDSSFELDLTQHWSIVNQMISQGYEVDEKWLAQTFNVPITGRREPSIDNSQLSIHKSLYRNFQ